MSRRTRLLGLLQRRFAPELRAIALFLLPLHLLTLAPAQVLAQAVAPLSVAPAAELPAAPLIAPAPALLAAQESALAVPALVTTPPPLALSKPRVRGVFDAAPTAEAIADCGLFPARLVPLGTASPGSNVTLAAALTAFSKRTKADDDRALRDWLAATTDSPWRAAVLAALAGRDSSDGRLERALAGFQAAADLARGARTLEEKMFADRVNADLAQTLTELGKVEEAAAVVRTTERSTISGVAAERLLDVKAATVPGRLHARGGGCGIEALGLLCRAVLPQHKTPPILSDRPQLRQLGFEATGGTRSFSQVQALGALAGLVLEQAQRTGQAPYPAPAILHWKRGHFAAVIQSSGDRYLVRDPSLRGDRWMTATALDEECSGFALVVGRKLPPGWISPNASAFSKIIGKSTTPPGVPKNPKPCAPGTGGSCGSGSCGRMASHRIHLAHASLRVTDPVGGYAPPVGPPVDFTVHYNQRTTVEHLDGDGLFVGRSWTADVLSYVESPWFEVSYVPGPNGSVLGSWSASVYLPGGGFESYVGDLDIQVSPPSAGFVTISVALSSARDAETGHRLASAQTYQVVVPEDDPGGVLQFAAPEAFTRTLADQTVERYGAELDGNNNVFAGAVWNSRAYLARTIHPSKAETQYSYSGPRLMEIASLRAPGDPNPLRASLYYDQAGPGGWADRAVTRFVDPYGRTARLVYDAEGRLFQSIDPQGITSTYLYEGATDRLASIVTPYGATTVAYGDESQGQGRWVETTDAYGARERVEVRLGNSAVGDLVLGGAGTVAVAEVPQDFEGLNEGLAGANTLHWSKRAMQEMLGDHDSDPATPDEVIFDDAQARVYHWMIDPAANELSTAPHSEKAPLERRVWYEYPGATSREIGAGEDAYWPTKVARVLDDGVTQTRQYAYTNLGKVGNLIDPAGRETRYTYANGQDLSKIEQKNGGSYEVLAEYLGYNDKHLPGTTIDAAGQQTAYTYTTEGKVKTVTRTRQYQGATTQEVTEYFYYPANAPGGNASRLQEIRGPGNVLLSSFKYDVVGRVAETTGADGYTLRHYYDALDRPVRTVFPDGTYEQTIYNRLDAEWQRDRQGRWTRTEHNALQQVVAVTDPLGRKTQFDWCACGTLEAIIDAKGQQTTFFYDLQSRVTDKLYPAVAGQPANATSYIYETTTSRLKSMTDALGQRTNYEYFLDNNLKKTSFTTTAGASLEWDWADEMKVNAPVEYTYDPVYNRVMTMTDGTGTTSYGYHPVNGPTAPLGDGRLASVDGPLANDMITYSYDEYGRTTQRQINGVANSVMRVYDALGRASGETNPVGSFGYGYVGNTGRLASLDNGAGFKTTYDYWPMIAPTPGSGDGDFRLKAINHFRDTTTLAAKYSYGYAPAGNITRWDQWNEGVTDPTRFDLGYDAADQLTGAVKKNAATGAEQQRSAWRYDAAANREVEQLSTPNGSGGFNTALTVASYNARNQMTSRSGGTGALEVEGRVNEPATIQINGQSASAVGKYADGSYWFRGTKMATSGANTVTVTATDAANNSSSVSTSVNTGSSPLAIVGLNYDAAGNLVSHDVQAYEMSYQWDAVNQLIAIYYWDSSFTAFTYDGLGRRVRIVEYDVNGEITGDHRFVWEGLSIAERRDAATYDVERRYYSQGWANGTASSPAAADRNLYRHDHLGSVREVVNASTGLASRYNYDLWGRCTVLQQASAATASDFAYTGHYYHGPSALHLAPYRAYSAELGRWLSRDPMKDAELLPEGPNLYSYVANEPITGIDPDGRTLYLCTTPTLGTQIAKHSYFYDTETQRRCERQESTGGGRRNRTSVPDRNIPKPGDFCVAVADGPQAKDLMDCCDKTANSGIWAPFVNDCHNSLDRCLKKAGVPIPDHPRFGKPKCCPN